MKNDIPIHIIVAVDEKNGIGKNNGLSWNLPEDITHFKNVTTSVKDPTKQNAVVMGRKTWESIPKKFRPLSNRLNIVVTRNESYSLPQEVVRLEQLISFRGAELHPPHLLDSIESIFIIGGASIYKQALESLPLHTIYLTKVFASFDCDVFFPDLENQLDILEESEVLTSANGVRYQFITARLHKSS